MIMLPDPDAICSGLQLSKVIGVSGRQVERLTVSGVLKSVRCKARGRHYRLAESIQSYLSYREQFIIERTKGLDDNYLKARCRRMEASAEMAELELKRQKGQLHHSSDVEFIVGMMMTNMRDRMLSIPSRAMHQLVGLSSPQKANQIVGDEIELGLRELSTADLRAKFRQATEEYLTKVTQEMQALPNGAEAHENELPS